MSVLLTLSINIIFYCAGVATPDPAEAPPLAEFNMKSPVVYIAPVRLFLSAALCKNHEASPQSAQSPQRFFMDKRHYFFEKLGENSPDSIKFFFIFFRSLVLTP